MKKNKLVFGGIAIGALALGTVAVSHFTAVERKYAHQPISVADEFKKPDGAKLWWDAHHIDEETGLVATQEKIEQGLQEARLISASQPRVSELAWAEQGPDNYGGRTRAICVDRKNENHVYAGSVSGGLFETFDKGNNWQKVPDWDAFMYISAIVQTNDGNVFVGTGDGRPFSEPFSVGGRGVYYKNTNDPNSVWTLVPGTGDWNVNELATNRVNNKLYIAGQAPVGLRVWDIATGGTPTALSVGSGACNEVEVSEDGQVILCRFGENQASGAFSSQDGGNNFIPVHGSAAEGKVPAGAGGRFEMAISKNRVNGEYVCYINGTNSTTAGVFRSANSGVNWAQIAPGSQSIDSPVNFYGQGQGRWNSTNAVDPTNPNRLLVGGLDIHEWTLATNEPVTGGWAQLSLWFLPQFAPLYVHADNHRIVFDSSNRMYIGNDGGIGISDNIGNTFYAANRGYSTIQFYSVAVDGNGRLLGGTQDNGTLYNNLQNATPREFRQPVGGDGFDTAISFYNPQIMFASIYYGCIRRSGNGGESFGEYIPNYVGYQTPCELESGGDYHFNTKLGLGEFYDENSKDTVQYSPTFSATAGTMIEIPSFATGNLIPFTLPNNVYFDDTVFFNPSLSVTDFEVQDATTSTTYQLFPLTWTNVTAPGQAPQVGHVLSVTAPTVFTINVQSVSTYNRLFAQHPTTGKMLDLVTSEFVTNVAWDTLKVADPYQSIFLTHARKNGGELYLTRDALRLASSNVKWSQVVTGIGQMFVGEIAFSANLEHVYVGTDNGLWRIDGIRDVYSTEADFAQRTDLRLGNAPAITKTLIFQGAVSGVSVNPNNPGDVLVTRAGVGGTGRVFRSTTADVATGTGTFNNVSGNLSNNVACYDVLVDREDSDMLIVGTDFGVWFSMNGGTTWTYSSEGFGEVPVYRIVQNWREGHPNTSRPGEIYIATHGRGMFASDSVLDIDNVATHVSADKKFEVMVYPNPLHQEGTLRFEMLENANVQIDIYNLSGHLVYSAKEYKTSGVQNIEFDATRLENGAYIIKVNAGKHSASAKFIKY
jgi:hypothetical protein